MKIKNLLLTVLLIIGSTTVQAQILKKLKEKVTTAADRKINNTVDRAISKTTDKVVDSAAHTIGKVTKGAGRKKKQRKSIPETEQPVGMDSTARKEAE